MKTVSLICTVHEEIGRANVHELHAILERIGPEVAFIEVPAAWGRERVENHRGLESSALLKYRETRSLSLVPVDLPIPPASFFRDSEQLFDYIERVSGKYRQLMDKNKGNLVEAGFSYLNGDLHGSIQSEIHDEVLRILAMRDSPSLTQDYEAWRRQDDLRDIEMISNIEKYGRENEFGRAVFLVGAAHRPSIVKKLGERVLSGLTGLQWEYSNDWYR